MTDAPRFLREHDAKQTTQRPGDVVRALNNISGLDYIVDRKAVSDAIALIQSQAAEITRLRAQPDAAAMREAMLEVVEDEYGELARCRFAERICALPLPPAAQEEKL